MVGSPLMSQITLYFGLYIHFSQIVVFSVITLLLYLYHGSESNAHLYEALPTLIILLNTDIGSRIALARDLF